MDRPKNVVRRWLFVFEAGVVFALIAGVLSYITTVNDWAEGDWPDADLWIRIRAPDGSPVEGAKLTLYKQGELATGFQTAFCFPSDLVSTKDGNINLLVKPIRYHIRRWQLFWIIPFRKSSVDFEARIHAPGFRPASMPFAELLDGTGFKRRRPWTDADQAKGYPFPEEFYVFEVEVVLDQ